MTKAKHGPDHELETKIDSAYWAIEPEHRDVHTIEIARIQHEAKENVKRTDCAIQTALMQAIEETKAGASVLK